MAERISAIDPKTGKRISAIEPAAARKSQIEPAAARKSQIEPAIVEFHRRSGAWKEASEKDRKAMAVAATKDMRSILFGLVSPDDDTFFPGRIPGSIVSLIARGLYAKGHPTEALHQAIGNMLSLLDRKVFVPINKLCVGRFKNDKHYKRIKAVLRKHGEIRTHLVSSNRRVVHAGDWALFLHEQQARQPDSVVAQYREQLQRHKAESENGHE